MLRTKPYFSEAYDDEQAAQDEALARFRGEPSRHQSLSAVAAVARKQRWEAYIVERERTIEEMRAYLATDPDVGISALRKPEAKIASHLKQLGWQIAEYRHAGVSEQMISLAERQKAALGQLADQVAAQITAKEALRKPRSAPVSASTLSDDLRVKADNLIRKFVDAPVMSDEEQERLLRATMQKAPARMLGERLTYGQASSAPDFLNQDEAAFREFMKTADQDLAWQCDTVDAAFERYRQSGEVPGPHYAMRITVLLRRAKDFDRERRFLAAWCKHFPSGNGVTYAALADRAKKVGALSPSGQ